jgi:tRNA 2-selenouridine synthase
VIPAASVAARNRVGIEALATYPVRIDVRTPAEFAIDHVPGAINCPVLSNDERARVGTLHAQSSAFEAKKVGAALISRNIAAIVEAFADRPRDWSPLVYCWRGGQRSRSLAHVMNEIGWGAVQLEGGYRTWRRHVVRQLVASPATFEYRVVCGLTGSGKSRLLTALATEGAQVLDLERLACHRGSLLGDMPDAAQPSQKGFESALFDALSRLDPARPVLVESESKKIGRVQVPDALLEAMRRSPCVRLETQQALRIALLKEEYAHFLADPVALAARLQPLVPLLGRATIDRWTASAAAGEFDALVAELLAIHYDPTYTRSIERNFPNFAKATVVTLHEIADEDFRRAARELVTHVEGKDAERRP